MIINPLLTISYALEELAISDSANVSRLVALVDDGDATVVLGRVSVHAIVARIQLAVHKPRNVAVAKGPTYSENRKSSF
jgi:hypothetical protein